MNEIEHLRAQLAAANAAREEAERERDEAECDRDAWRANYVTEEERGRQFGLRAQAETDRAFLLELLRITVMTGTKDPLLDARLREALREATSMHWSGTATKPEER